MSGPENIDIARRYLTALSAGAGANEVAQFYAPDVVQEEFPNRLMPNGATRDLQALKDGRSRGQALLGAENFALLNAVAHDSQVAMEVVWTATVKQAAGPFAGGSRCVPGSPSSWNSAAASSSASGTTTVLIPGEEQIRGSGIGDRGSGIGDPGLGIGDWGSGTGDRGRCQESLFSSQSSGLQSGPSVITSGRNSTHA